MRAVVRGRQGHQDRLPDRRDPTFDPNNTVMDEAQRDWLSRSFTSCPTGSARFEHEMAALSGEALEKIPPAVPIGQHEFDLTAAMPGGTSSRRRSSESVVGDGRRGATECADPSRAASARGWRSRSSSSASRSCSCSDEPTNHLDLGAIEWLER